MTIYVFKHKDSYDPWLWTASGSREVTLFLVKKDITQHNWESDKEYLEKLHKEHGEILEGTLTLHKETKHEVAIGG